MKKRPGITGGFPYSIAVIPDGGFTLTGSEVARPSVLNDASRSREDGMDFRINPGTPITADSLENLQSAIDDTRHSFARDRNTGAWHGYNPAQATSLVTTTDGVLLTTPAGTAGFMLTAIGRSGAMNPAGAGEISADGRVLAIRRADYSEWYRNSDTTITQGMDIVKRPDGDGSLLVRFDLAGNLTPSMKGQVLAFSGRDGKVLEYRNLRAWDLVGRMLPCAMALNGTTLTWGIDDSSAIYPITIDPDFILKQAEYSPGQPGDNFGNSVAVSGEYAVVGAMWNDTLKEGGYDDTGAVYFFKTSDGGTTWVLKQVEYSPGSPVEYFGTSVAVSGEYAVVGADYNDTLRAGYANAGAAYFYKTSDAGNTWVLKQVEYSPGISGDRFGYEVRVAGDYAVIGAPYNDTLQGNSDAGAAYFYTTADNGNTWVLKQAEYSPGKASDYFGFSVAVSGDYAAVGAPFNDTLRAGYSNAGAIYFYATPDSGDTWVLKQAEYSPGISGDYFGRSVAVSDDYAVVGAYYNDTVRAGYADAGAVYFYTTTDSGDTWVLRQAEYSPGSTFEWFASTVSVSGNYAVVGAAKNDSVRAGYADAGATYLYTTADSGNTWVLSHAEYSPGIAGDNFGTSVSVSGNYAVMGARYNNTLGSEKADAGAAYFYLMTATPPVAGFSGNITSGTAPLAVLFTDSSTNMPSSWNWSFGDGTFSTLQNPVHTYITAGTYTVALNATNSDGSDTLTQAGYITVSPSPPVAAFSGSPTSGTSPLSVTFTDSSANTPTGWAWFFGDETYTNPWTKVNASAGWGERSFHTSVAMPDGSIVLMGGVDNIAGYRNDVWRSTDAGATWTRVNASAGWTERDEHTSLVTKDGTILLMGGKDVWNNPFNDVWTSTDKGATWAEVNTSAGWTARYRFSSTALPDGSVVIMGGNDGAGGLHNDVWRSTDAGATWTEMTSAAGWSERREHASVATPDGSIILTGGYATSPNSNNDTWRSTDNGATWTRMNASSGWTARYEHTSVALPDGSVLVMGGARDSTILNDTWRSIDNGATWTQVNASAGWPARYRHSSVATAGGSIVVTGGEKLAGRFSDVWRFNPTGSSLQNPSHTYASAGTYSVTLQASNAGGYNALRRIDYITATATSAPAPVSSGSDSSSSDGPATGGSAPAAAPAPVVQPPAPVVQLQPAAAPPQEEPVTEEPGLVSESYPMGFDGLSFNADNQNTLSLDLAAASETGAEVTQYFDRVEIYQHGSPGVRIAFYGTNFTVLGRKIVGKVDRAEFRTDPLIGNITEGNVTASVRSALLALTTRVTIDETLCPNATAGAVKIFRSTAAGSGLDIAAVAFTLDVTKAESLQAGAANITMTVPAPWVEQNGGRDVIRISRVPANEIESELLETRYLGTDQAGALVFEAYSPRGTSLFGLLAVKAQETKATPAPTGGEPAPVPKTAVTTITGMVSWVVLMLEKNLFVGIPVAVIVVVFLLYAWRQKRQY